MKTCILYKYLFNFLFQFSCKQMSSVNDIIRPVFQEFHFFPFKADTVIYASVHRQRMASPRLFIKFGVLIQPPRGCGWREAVDVRY